MSKFYQHLKKNQYASLQQVKTMHDQTADCTIYYGVFFIFLKALQAWPS